jgi:acetyl-CoA carboxylase alpha subunit
VLKHSKVVRQENQETVADVAEARRVQVAKPGSRFETVEIIAREFDQAGNRLGEKTVLSWKKPSPERPGTGQPC